MELRPYQSRMIDELRQHLRQGRRRVMMQLPTGGGKTVIAAFLTSASRRKSDATVWFVCHRDFLIEQTYETYLTVGLDPAVIASGKTDRFRPLAPVQVCGVATLVNRLDTLPKPDIIIFDEAHHIAAGTWKKVLEWADCIAIGLSATPERLDGKGLNDFFDVMVLGPAVRDLMEMGSLSRYRAFAPPVGIDFSELRTRAGDFVIDDLEQEVDQPDIIGDVVEQYQKHAAGTRAIYFAVSVRHSQHIADAFNAAGVPALHLDANSKPQERAAAARAFATGKLSVLSNVNLFSEGYDLAAQAGMPVTIETVGMCRPTQSLAMYLQQVGRALRPKDYPAIILDHAGNIERHGLPDDDREWTLEGRKKNPGHVGVKICPSCFAANPQTAILCEACGTKITEKDEERGPRKDPTIAEDVDLEEVNAEMLRANRQREEQEAETLEDFLALAAARGYKKGWAYKRFQVRQERKAKWAPQATRPSRSSSSLRYA